uniref:Uncharacterized protein n=1 Tax=Balaenoptera musculus TaxID=9771 RepID=A0A8C0I4H8_BALMU
MHLSICPWALLPHSESLPSCHAHPHPLVHSHTHHHADSALNTFLQHSCTFIVTLMHMHTRFLTPTSMLMLTLMHTCSHLCTHTTSHSQTHWSPRSQLLLTGLNHRSWERAFWFLPEVCVCARAHVRVCACVCVCVAGGNRP